MRYCALSGIIISAHATGYFLANSTRKNEEPGNIATHHNGEMADDTVKIPQLGFPFQVEIMFHHLEEHPDTPPFAVDADNFFVGKVDPGGGGGQPLALSAVVDKNDLNLLALFGFHHHAGQHPGLTPAFAA